MTTTVTKSEFRDAFYDHNRGDQFGYNGLGALFDFFEQLEEDTGNGIELYVIALCCDFSEHDSAVDCISDNGYGFGEHDPDHDEDEREEAALEYLQERTNVLQFEGGIIIQQF